MTTSSTSPTQQPEKTSSSRWYKDAQKYWANVDASVDGMLGGFEQLSEPDARANFEFISEFLERKEIGTNRACDCGAGIGRVSKTFLLHVFNSVDLVEQNPQFLEEARVHFNNRDSSKDTTYGKVEKYIAKGLQSFEPEEGRYNVVWAQWVLGHLTDEDLESFFKRCKDGLVPGGMVFVKENILRAQEVAYEVDEVDSSMTRSDAVYQKIFKNAGLEVVKQEIQKDFPADLYPVKMYALRFTNHV